MKKMFTSPVIVLPNPLFAIHCLALLVGRNAKTIGKFIFAVVCFIVLCLVFIAAAGAFALGLYFGLSKLYEGGRGTDSLINLFALAALVFDVGLLIKGLRHAASWTLGEFFTCLIYVPSRGDGGGTSTEATAPEEPDWGHGAR